MPLVEAKPQEGRAAAELWDPVNGEHAGRVGDSGQIRSRQAWCRPVPESPREGPKTHGSRVTPQGDVEVAKAVVADCTKPKIWPIFASAKRPVPGAGIRPQLPSRSEDGTHVDLNGSAKMRRLCDGSAEHHQEVGSANCDGPHSSGRELQRHTKDSVGTIQRTGHKPVSINLYSFSHNNSGVGLSLHNFSKLHKNAMKCHADVFAVRLA